MAFTLLSAATLTGSNQASSPLLLSGERCELWFTIVVTVGTVSVNWFMEFTDAAPASGVWYQEVAEEDAGKGVVSMPKVLRTFADNGGTTLAIGTHNLAVPFTRQGPMARVQVSASGAGTAVCSISAPFGGQAR